MVVRADILEAFEQSKPYFNTFAGSPVAMAAAQATLDTMREIDTAGNARKVGGLFAEQLKGLAAEHPVLGDVRSAGLYIGVDVVKPGTTQADYPLSVSIIETLREKRVLASLCGPYGNVLKIRPPLVFSENDVDWFMSALAKTLDDLGC